MAAEDWTLEGEGTAAGEVRMRHLLAVVAGGLICLGASPASAQLLGGPVRLSAEYAGSVQDGPAGWRWGEALRTLTGRFDFLAQSRVSPWLATGLDLNRNCGFETCPENGWSNVAGIRADVLPVRPERRLNPFLVAGYGGVVTFDGSGGSIALAGGGVRFTTRRGIDPLVELHWERHQRHDFAMLAVGVNGLLRLRAPSQ